MRRDQPLFRLGVLRGRQLVLWSEEVLRAREPLLVGNQYLRLKLPGEVVQLLRLETRALARQRHGDAIKPDRGHRPIVRE